MDRKAEKEIISFIKKSKERENSTQKRCLLVEGLRQTGKTYSIRKCLGFPESDLYSSFRQGEFPVLGKVICLYLALDRNPELIPMLDEWPADAFLEKVNLLPAYSDLDLHPSLENRIVLAIDEIGLSKTGVSKLKHFAAIAGLTLIASGSMLGILNTSEAGYPIGFVERIAMYPLDFEEFLMAAGYSQSFLERLLPFFALGKPLPEPLHEELSSLYKRFVLVGGLPFFADKYIKGPLNPDALYADAAMRIGDYEGDIAKFADLATKIRGQEIFSSVKSSLMRDASKYFYSDIKKGAKGREYRLPLEWLLHSKLLYRVKDLSIPEIPLGLNAKEDSFKLYYADQSMLYGRLGPSIYPLVNEDMPSIGKGALYENAAAAILYPLTRGNLYYYSRETGLEIDFAMEYGARTVFIEIKSSRSSKSKSLSTLMKEYPSAVGMKFSFSQSAKNGNLYSLPLYSLPFIRKILDFGGDGESA